MPQYLQFYWTALRRYKVEQVDGMHSQAKKAYMELCEMELAQLAVDADGNPVCFFIRCASDAMFPAVKS